MRRFVPYLLGLCAAWVMLWDRVTLANILGGLVVAAVLLTMFPIHPVAPAHRIVVRPLALARLGAAVLGQLAVSNLLVAREVVSPRRELRTGIVACPLRTDSPKVLSTVANIIALSPGMVAIDSTRDPPTLYVHVLTLDDLAGVRRQVARLERLVVDALGSAAARQALAEGAER